MYQINKSCISYTMLLYRLYFNKYNLAKEKMCKAHNMLGSDECYVKKIKQESGMRGDSNGAITFWSGRKPFLSKYLKKVRNEMCGEAPMGYRVLLRQIT